MPIVGSEGSVTVTVTYYSEDLLSSYSTAKTIPLEGSSLLQGTTSVQPGGEPTEDGTGWPFLRELVIPWRDFAPPDFETDETVQRPYTNWAAVEVSATAECGARIVDLVAYSVPAAHTFESADTDVAIHGATSGQASTGLYPRRYTVEKADARTPDDDPRMGTEWLCAVNAALHQQGPQILNWHAWDEGSASVTDTETDTTTTSTSFVELLGGAAYSYDATAAGWGVSSPGYARRRTWADPKLGLPNRASFPARVSVYGKVTGGTGTVRIQSSNESWIDVSVTGTSMAWTTGVGFLECGQGADDDTVLQAAIKVSSAQTLTVRAISVHYDERAPTV